MDASDKVMYRPLKSVAEKVYSYERVPFYLASLKAKDREMFQVSFTLLTIDQKQRLLVCSNEYEQQRPGEPFDLDKYLMDEFNFDMYNNSLVYNGQVRAKIIAEGRAREKMQKTVGPEIFSETGQTRSWMERLLVEPVIKVLPEITLDLPVSQLISVYVSDITEGVIPQEQDVAIRLSELHPFGMSLKLVGGQTEVLVLSFDQDSVVVGEPRRVEQVVSEIHPFRVDCYLMGGGRGKTTGHTIMDLTLGGKKRLKPKLRREDVKLEINNCVVCEDLDRVPQFRERDLRLDDYGYEGTKVCDDTLSEAIQGRDRTDHKSQCSLMVVELSVDSYITEVLTVKNADASLLRSICLPRLVHETTQNSVNRYIFRARGQELEKYFVAHVDVCPRCTLAACGKVGCNCVLKVQGVRNLFGYYSEMRLTDRASTQFLFLDIEEKFVLRGSEVVPKGVRRGFNFDESMCTDFCRFEEKMYREGSSLLTSVPYLPLVPNCGLDEKTLISFSIRLRPGTYEIIAFPTKFKLAIQDNSVFSRLRDINGSAGGVVEVAFDKDTVCKLSSHCDCTCVVESVRDAFWAIAWCRIDGGRYEGEVKFVSKFRFIDN